MYEPNTVATFDVTVSAGSHVQTTIDYGDGTVTTEPADTSSSLAPLSWQLQHTYASPGTYSVTVTRLFNELYEDTTNLTAQVVIQNAITALTLTPVPTAIASPPGDISFTLSEGNGQLTLTDIDCAFTNSGGPETWTTRSSTLPHSFGTAGSSVSETPVPAFARYADVTLTITATCSNLLTTDFQVTTSLDIVENSITLTSLDTNSGDWWENATVVTLILAPPPSPVTYSFTVDSVGSTECRLETGVVTGDGCDIQETVDTDRVTVVLRYTYATWGSFEMDVLLSNGYPQYDVTRLETILVREWTCSPPTIALPDDVTTPNERSILRSMSDSIAVTVTSIDCMKSQEVTYAWQIENESGERMAAAEAETGDLTSAQLLLPDRLTLADNVPYVARVIVTMVIDTERFGAGAPVEATAVANFRYLPSPMVAVLADHGES